MSELPIILRADVIAQVEAHLDGRLSQSNLAGWAFARFYAEELGQEAYEQGAEEALADALDVLMFDDDPSFALDEVELRDLIAKLR
ncbi:MAG: hypothetical protein H7Z42_05105 [Roseiflexaceae bacterium]|nr:hypothetical protein [Roseiflexaceae bacterium]